MEQIRVTLCALPFSDSNSRSNKCNNQLDGEKDKMTIKAEVWLPTNPFTHTRKEAFEFE
jgi:hypothetical protein